MGIPFYFASLLKHHRGITHPVNDVIDVDVLGVDFNCLIHRYIDDASPIPSILKAFEYILENTCRPKKLLIAIDGVVPYAKIVQQRYRRMRLKEPNELFDRNQISPGTPFMKDLETALVNKFPYAIISNTSEEGEGEHKLFNMLRTLPESDRRNVCIYGLDADLILISLQHSKLAKTMTLLRESGEFNDPSLSSSEFSIMSVSGLADVLPLPIDQYIALSILCFGNDFMPCLGMFSLREGGYERALEVYEKAGKPDLLTYEGRDCFLDVAEREEMQVLKHRINMRRRPEEKALLGDQFVRQYGLHILDGVQDMKSVVEAFWITFHWTLHYFQMNSPINWNWVYPYPEAPLIRSILDIEGETKAVAGGKTFGIPKQLGFILPSNSIKIAKKKQVYPDEIYTETRHPWMKRYDWETKPRISLPWNPKFKLTEIVRHEMQNSSPSSE